MCSRMDQIFVCLLFIVVVSIQASSFACVASDPCEMCILLGTGVSKCICHWSLQLTLWPREIGKLHLSLTPDLVPWAFWHRCLSWLCCPQADTACGPAGNRKGKPRALCWVSGWELRVLWSKNFLTLIKIRKEYTQDCWKRCLDYCNRGERSSSTLNTARTNGDLQPRNRVGRSVGKITKRRHQR